MKKFVLVLFIVFALAGSVAQEAQAKTKAQPTPTPPSSANRTALNKVLKFWVYEKGGDLVGDVGGIFDQKIKTVILKCGLMNLTKKDIRGVRGVLRFTTLFGDYICDISLETTAAVPAGQRVSIEWKAGSDRFTPEGLQKFQKLKLEEMRQLWYPRMIVFTDGTTLR